MEVAPPAALAVSTARIARPKPLNAATIFFSRIEIIINSFGLMRKIFFQLSCKFFFAFGEVILPIANNDMIIAIWIELTKGKVFGNAQSFISFAQRTTIPPI